MFRYNQPSILYINDSNARKSILNKKGISYFIMLFLICEISSYGVPMDTLFDGNEIVTFFLALKFNDRSLADL